MKRDRKKRCGAAAAANKSALCDVDHAHKPMRGVRLLRVLAEQKENCRAVSCGNAAGEKNVQGQRTRIRGPGGVCVRAHGLIGRGGGGGTN